MEYLGKLYRTSDRTNNSIILENNADGELLILDVDDEGAGFFSFEMNLEKYNGIHEVKGDESGIYKIDNGEVYVYHHVSKKFIKVMSQLTKLRVMDAISKPAAVGYEQPSMDFKPQPPLPSPRELVLEEAINFFDGISSTRRLRRIFIDRGNVYVTIDGTVEPIDMLFLDFYKRFKIVGPKERVDWVAAKLVAQMTAWMNKNPDDVDTDDRNALHGLTRFLRDENEKYTQEKIQSQLGKVDNTINYGRFKDTHISSDVEPDLNDIARDLVRSINGSI